MGGFVCVCVCVCVVAGYDGSEAGVCGKDEWAAEAALYSSRSPSPPAPSPPLSLPPFPPPLLLLPCWRTGA
jgi:hypothetical protein